MRKYKNENYVLVFFAIFSKTKKKKAYLYKIFFLSFNSLYAPEVLMFKFQTLCIYVYCYALCLCHVDHLDAEYSRIVRRGR